MMMMGSSTWTKAIKWLVIVTLAVFTLQNLPFTGSLLNFYGQLIPRETFLHLQVWRLISYMFLHGSLFHFIVNMLILWMFGVEMETIWGTRKFTLFYLLCGAGSGCFSIVSLFTSAYAIPVIGASGAVLAVLTAYSIYYPHREILLFFVLPVNIRIFVLGYALYSVFGSIVPHGNISHLTHLGGIIVALFYVKLYPYISDAFGSFSDKVNEKRLRQSVEEQKQRKRFFEENVDPILEKISREGMLSLTKNEKDTLKKAASLDSERLKRRKIIPFDPFR